MCHALLESGWHEPTNDTPRLTAANSQAVTATSAAATAENHKSRASTVPACNAMRGCAAVNGRARKGEAERQC